MKYSILVLCAHGAKCPELYYKDGKTWNRRHGSAGFACRIPTSLGIKQIKRYGYPSKADAEGAAKTVGKLLDLAGADQIIRAKIGDQIMKATRAGPLPDVEDVARRLSLHQDPGDPGVTFAEAWAAWLSGNRRLRPSARRRLEGIAEHWLLPVLADVPLERLNGAHCTAVFDRIDAINAEIAAQEAAGKKTIQVQGDLRQRPKIIGIASQHRVFAALRTILNFEVKVTHRLVFNPVYAVRLEPEETPEAERWSAREAARFLIVAAEDPLGLMFRIAVLRGSRRGELCGFRWTGSDLDAGYLSVDRPLLQLGGKIVEGKPKTRSSGRKVWLDAETARLLREHRESQLAARLRAGHAWQDNDLVFCKDDGSPWPPDYVYRRFRALAKAAGVPVIKLHEGGRHTSASLARDAEVDPEIRRKTLGHADQAMTSHYTHIEAQAHRAAAEAVARLVHQRPDNNSP
jgi:integrase